MVQVHAYLDGELSVSESAEAERAIASSNQLAAEAAVVRALKRALQSLPAKRLPPHLATRIDRRFGLGQRSWQPTWLMLAASVVMAMALSSLVTTGALRSVLDRVDRVDGIYAESVDNHLRSLIASRPVDVAAAERHIVKPWFNGKSVHAPKVAELAAEGFPLVGARVDVIRGTPVPVIVYKRRLHTVSVWVATGPLSALLTTSALSLNGTNVIVWRTDDMTYWAASDLNAAELAAFARLYAAAP